MEEIVLESSVYLDVAIIIAGYPATKGKQQNASVAKELIAVNSTIVCMVHFAADFFCNASKYPHWYAEFELAVMGVKANKLSPDLASAMRAGLLGGLHSGFMSFTVPGNHKDSKKLWRTWDFAEVSSELDNWFEIMWFQLECSRGICNRIR